VRCIICRISASKTSGTKVGQHSFKLGPMSHHKSCDNVVLRLCADIRNRSIQDRIAEAMHKRNRLYSPMCNATVSIYNTLLLPISGGSVLKLYNPIFVASAYNWLKWIHVDGPNTSYARNVSTNLQTYEWGPSS
jgi:hypothetical protein